MTLLWLRICDATIRRMAEQSVAASTSRFVFEVVRFVDDEYVVLGQDAAAASQVALHRLRVGGYACRELAHSARECDGQVSLSAAWSVFELCEGASFGFS